jgi:regulatory protein
VKISKVEPQKKNKNRCSIYIDGDFRFGLTKELALKYDLKEGDEISETEINDMLLQEEKGKIRNRAFKILHYRQRSTRELRKRLIRIGFDVALVDSVIEDLRAESALNDEQFAQAFISDYTALKPKGNKFIINELLKRGISQEVISELLDKRDERTLIKRFIERKLSHLDKAKPKERQKIIRRLLYHGFTSDIIYEVINEY